ncbi:putative Ig domain-containing protein [Arthrobacter sp. HLT1-20]
MVSGSVMVAGTAQASVSAEVAVRIEAGPQVNQPLANSGCYPSGLSRSYSVVTFRTTTSGTGSFRAAVTAQNGELVAALYDGSFTPTNTVARCLKRTVGAAAGDSASIHWSAPASADSTDAHTWSLVVFADAATAVDASVSLTSNGTVSIEGQPLTLLAEDLADAAAGQRYEGTVASINGTPPYKYSGTGFPSGLAIDALTGAISGTPAAGGAFMPVVTVTDSAATPVTASKTLPLIVVAEAPPTTPAPTTPAPATTAPATTAPATTIPETTVPSTTPPAETTPAATSSAPTIPAETAQPPTTRGATESGANSPAGAASAAGAGTGKLPTTGSTVLVTAAAGSIILAAGLVVTGGIRRGRARHS